MEVKEKHFLAQVELLDEVGITVEGDALVMDGLEKNGRNMPNADDWTEGRNQKLAI